jgi:hypothetical protein
MISISRLLDYVVEILKAAGHPLVARELCNELSRKGVTIEKTDLNQILWKQNNRLDLVVDKKTFKWCYDPAAAKQTEKAEKRKEEIRGEVVEQAAFLELWENIGFEFIGVWRKNTDKPFFFLREDGDSYAMVGPSGNLIHEKSVLCSKPETLNPRDFTRDQVKKAAEEILREKRRQATDHAHEIVTVLREIELLADEVYMGPTMVRVEDAIPVSGVIFVANVSAFPETIKIGWGTVLSPLYLVVNILGFGIKSDARYGVFKLCVYELIKRELAVEFEDGFSMTVSLANDRVCIGGENGRSSLLVLE